MAVNEVEEACKWTPHSEVSFKEKSSKLKVVEINGVLSFNTNKKKKKLTMFLDLSISMHNNFYNN